MGSTKTLCVDIDGVTAATVESWLREAGKEYGIHKRKEDITNYDMGKSLGVPSKLVLEIFKKVWADYKEIELVDQHAPEVLSILRNKFYIYIVTASVANDESIRSWLELNKISYDKLMHLSNEKEKLSISGDIFVEDNPSIAIELSRKGKEVILMEQDWNKSLAGNGIPFAKNWLDVLDIINKRHGV